MKQPRLIELETDQYRSEQKPWRLTPKKRLLPLFVLYVFLLGLTTWWAMTEPAWWSLFLPWPFVMGLGALIAYAWPQFFFDEDG